MLCFLVFRKTVRKLLHLKPHHSQTMEYYLAIKRDEVTDTCCNTDEPLRGYAKRKKPDTKGHIL